MILEMLVHMTGMDKTQVGCIMATAALDMELCTVAEWAACNASLPEQV